MTVFPYAPFTTSHKPQKWNAIVSPAASGNLSREAKESNDPSKNVMATGYSGQLACNYKLNTVFTSL